MGVSSSRFSIIQRASTSFAISVLAVLAAAQQPKVLAPHDPIAPRVKNSMPQTPVPGSIAGGPWIVDANFKSILYLKNVVETSSVTVTPVVYLSNGTKYPLSPVQLEPSGIANVDIGASLQTLGVASNTTLSGWVELQYNWAWQPLCAMIKDIDETHSVVFGFGFATPGPLSAQSQQTKGSQVREGMWWKQEKNVSGFVALANTTSQSMSAEVDVEDSNGAVLGSHAIAVPPLGMETLNLQELQTTSGNMGGIRVHYVGGLDDLLINGGLEDIGVGYSANVPFTAPERPLPSFAHKITPQSFSELGLMTGAADPYMHFPAGTTFTVYSLLRNVSPTPISVTPTLWWMQGSAPVSFQLPSIRLTPYHTYSLDMPSLLDIAGLKNFSGSVNLVFDTQGGSGLLMASGSVDQTNTYVFEVAARGNVMSAGRGLSYWSTANGDDTMVTIWNPTDEAQTFVFRLMFAGGRQYDDVMTLGPRATKMFDVSEILATGGPDADGNVIPAGVQEGSAQIVGLEADNQHILLALDAGVYNVRKATCTSPCTTCYGATIWSVSVDPFSLAVGGQTQEHFYAQWNNGGQYEYTSNSTWTSNATGVATVQTGLVKGASVGSLTVSSSIYGEPVAVQLCGSEAPSCPMYGGGGSSSPGNVSSCPTGLSVSVAASKSLPDYNYPTYRTGVGILSLMTASPNTANYNNPSILETVTPVTNSCPSNIQSYTSLATITLSNNSSFQVGASAYWEGNSYPIVPGAFYDSNVQLVSADVLGMTTASTCKATATQVFYCNGAKIGTFTITNTYTHGSGVTNVAVTKTAN